jgi:thiamine-phosphate pyrophosphorylase
VISGLYAVTPELFDTELLLKQVALALQGGVSVVQYRSKSAPRELKEQQARSLHELCRQFSVPFIVNDDVNLAKEIGAEGVHLGYRDAHIRQAREILRATIIGASCYDRLELAEQRLREGADYVAFGSFFPSASKPDTVQAPLSLLRQAKQKLAAPVVAIGGITLGNAEEVIAAGADAVAVISALFDAKDIAAAAQRFSSLFEHRVLS